MKNLTASFAMSFIIAVMFLSPIFSQTQTTVLNNELLSVVSINDGRDIYLRGEVKDFFVTLNKENMQHYSYKRIGDGIALKFYWEGVGGDLLYFLTKKHRQVLWVKEICPVAQHFHWCKVVLRKDGTKKFKSIKKFPKINMG